MDPAPRQTAWYNEKKVTPKCSSSGSHHAEDDALEHTLRGEVSDNKPKTEVNSSLELSAGSLGSSGGSGDCHLVTVLVEWC